MDSAPHYKTAIPTHQWFNVVLGALLMLATLPGRTQGLGLITEPMLADLHLDHITYAQVNLWATLLGALFCFPAGYLLDRFSLRLISTSLTLLLGAVVWQMSAFSGGVIGLFVLLLLTRALGQSALSVVIWPPSRMGHGNLFISVERLLCHRFHRSRQSHH